jgi:uncharacterized protein YqeY
MIRDALDAGLKAAMQARDMPTVSLLRTTLGAIANAEAVDHADHPGRTEVARRELTEDDIRRIVEAERDELLGVATELEDIGADAGALFAQAAILQRYLG